MSVLDIQDASLILRDGVIFDNINMHVAKGHCHGLVGPDNEGKSSLLYCIVGLNKLSSGQIHIFGDIPYYNRSKFIKDVAFVPDELLCFSNMTGAQLLDLVMGIQGKRDWADATVELIEYFEVDPSIQLEYMTEDMNKCVYIISALLAMPELLILDEPFNFLSDINITKLKTLLRSYVEDGGTALIVSDHYNDISDICDEVTVVKDRSCTSSNLLVANIKKFKLITATDIDLKSIPDEFTVVEHNLSHCRMVYRDDLTHFNTLLTKLSCKDFTVEDITLEDIIYNKYHWLEELL